MKDFDLEPSEWRREGKPEPIFGFNGGYFLLLFCIAFPISALAAFLIAGEFPYWLSWIIPISWDGLGAWNGFILLVSGFVALALGEAILTFLRRPRR